MLIIGHMLFSGCEVLLMGLEKLARVQEIIEN